MKKEFSIDRTKKKILQLYKNKHKHTYRLGRHLTRLKKESNRDFCNTIKKEFPFGISYAYKCMDVFRAFPKASSTEGIRPTTLYHMSHPKFPTKKRKKIIRELRKGKKLEDKEIKKIHLSS